MATLIAYQDGNWTGATTWKAVATGTNASMTTTTSSTNTTTSYVDSSAFTVTNTEVLEGLLLYCNRVNTTGTVSVALSDDNGTTATREVTVNASDLPADQSWVFFKFGSTLTADGGSDYKVKVKGSSAGNATFYRDGTAGNWARIIRKSDTASVASTDITYICDELTGSGTKNDITVTMDSTASTSYGECNIGQGGVLSYGTSASTNYILDLSGNMNVWGGGTLSIGTSETTIPSTSTAVLSFTNATATDRGLEVRSGGTCTIYGATKSNTKALLTADANSGQKVFKIADTTGWAANDVVALASTTRTASESEKRTVQTVSSGTQITLSANLTNTHHGTAPYVGEVVNLTRNVKIRGTSTTLTAYLYAYSGSNFTASYAEFYNLGSNATNKNGIVAYALNTTVCSFSFCSFYDFGSTTTLPFPLQGATGSSVVEDCVFYFNTFITNGISLPQTSGVPSFQRNYVITTNNIWTYISDVGGIIKDNRFGGGGVYLNELAAVGTFKDNVAHSTQTTGGFVLGGTGTFEGLISWRNATGITMTSSSSHITLLNCSCYHNSNQNIDLSSNVPMRVLSSSFNGGSGASLTQTNYELFVTNTTSGLLFDSCTFGDIQAATNFMSMNTSNSKAAIMFSKCIFGDTVAIPNQNTNLVRYGPVEAYIGFDKFNNTAGSHRIYKPYGRADADQTTFRTAAPSEALLPNNASNKFRSGSKKFAVASGTTATVTVYVNKSATYNGNQPRLIVKANSIAGIASDTVLATASGGTGSWLMLTGITATVADNCVLEAYVDCDGTAGTVYVDDWGIA